MVRIDGEILIDRPAAEVFDFVVDERNEPSYNPRIVAAEKLSPGPVGLGTRFRAKSTAMGRSVEMERGWYKLMTPIVARTGRRQEQATWASLKQFLEDGGTWSQMRLQAARPPHPGAQHHTGLSSGPGRTHDEVRIPTSRGELPL